jgi:hypothetical protein
MTPEGKALSNIVILGFGFMLMFTAFQTCGNIEVAHRTVHSKTTTNIK